ncbi:serine hydrolase domain-containing protein [Streptomyces sp. URMC 123]|uniref:serine hydrolase domain-containing protein n=1 Tax=Streptomyces sp. URMC 123 TaxID=3423403 RepID=UPI003F1C4FF8
MLARPTSRLVARRTLRAPLLGATATAMLAGAAFTGPAARAPAPDRAPDHSAARAAMETMVRSGVPGVLAEVRVAGGPDDGRTEPRTEPRSGSHAGSRTGDTRSHPGDHVWHAAAGVTDIRTGRPRRPAEHIRIGSLTKTFVATVVLQLQAEGRLDLDDTLESRLPGLVRGHGHDGSRITVRQILNHTSGIYNYTEDPRLARRFFTEEFLAHRFATYPPRRLIGAAMAHAPLFPPGTGWSYSNTNYVIAGLLIEKVTGRPYAREIERRIIEPLGLRATRLPGTDHRMPRPAGRGYTDYSAGAGARRHDVTELNPSQAGASGEMISSVGDLNRFYRALLRGRLLPARQLAEMRTTVPVDRTGSMAYGLGLIEWRLSCGTTVWGHDGGIQGAVTSVTATGDGDHIAAFTANAHGDIDHRALVEAEFCGSGQVGSRPLLPLLTSGSRP